MLILKKFLRNNRGATAIEYGIILALIVIAIILGLSSIGSSVNNTFSTASSQVSR